MLAIMFVANMLMAALFAWVGVMSNMGMAPTVPTETAVKSKAAIVLVIWCLLNAGTLWSLR